MSNTCGNIDATQALPMQTLGVYIPGLSDYLDKATPSLLEFIPKHLHEDIINGTSTIDMAPYINAALARPAGAIDLAGHTYMIGSRLRPSQGSRITGRGTIKALPTFSDAALADGLNMLITIVNGLEIHPDVTLDGNSIIRADLWLYGARNKTAVRDVKLQGTIKNVSFIGIDISSNLRFWQNNNVSISANVENVGWRGINLEKINRLNMFFPSVYRAGYDAYMLSYCTDIVAVGFRSNKSTPPFIIYNGPGSYGGAEEGFLFGHFSCRNGRFSDFHLYDNRNAGSDGWGIGEDGAGGFDESRDLVVTNGIIEYAGLFGFDCTGGLQVENLLVIESKQQGLMLGYDLGGTMDGVRVKARLVRCGLNTPGSGAVAFLSPGVAPRTASYTVGTNQITILGGSGFHVVVDQVISGPGIPEGATVTAISGNAVTMSGLATSTQTTANVQFRGITHYKNIFLDVQVEGAINGMNVETDVHGHTTYENVVVTGDLSRDISNNSVFVMNGPAPSGFIIRPETKMKNAMPDIIGNGLSAFGRKSIVLYTGGNDLTYIQHGYPGQRLTIYMGADTYVKPDWANTEGRGANRIIGMGNARTELKAGSCLEAEYRVGLGWYVTPINAW